jgi:hypothetical protein
MKFRDKFLFSFLIWRAINRNMPPYYTINFVSNNTRNRETFDIPGNDIKNIGINPNKYASSRAFGWEIIPRKITI